MKDNSFSETQSAFAVVSPCSQCRNQLSEMSSDGKPFCPRRKWQQEQKIYMEQTGKFDPRLAPLVTTGTEGTDEEDSKTLRNPVYIDNGKMTLVWIATLRDNNGFKDSKNQTITPPILDPTFIPDHTDYIFCRSYPFIPAQHEAAYRQTGGFKEGDTVLAITATDQQYSSIPVAADSNLPEYQALMIGGVVNKVNLIYRTPRSPVEVDLTVEGT